MIYKHNGHTIFLVEFPPTTDPKSYVGKTMLWLNRLKDTLNKLVDYINKSRGQFDKAGLHLYPDDEITDDGFINVPAGLRLIFSDK